MGSEAWFLYALRCADGTLYTGVTTDLLRRLKEHNSGRGARYTAGRGPVHLLGSWTFESQSTAQRAEARFRRLPRRQKLQHIAQRASVSGSPFNESETVAGHLAPIRFCPRCGALLEPVELPTDRTRWTCSVCGRVDYRNPKPCAGVLVVRGGRLLMVKRAREPYLGFWDIPGGFLEVDELPDEGAVREVEEETGLKVKTTELFGFYRDIYSYGDEENHCLIIYFLGHVLEGIEKPGSEATDLAWFAPEELPEAIAFDHARRVLDDWAEWTRDRTRRSPV